MTSKEALEELEIILSTNTIDKHYADIYKEYLLKPIERDLDVLDILKLRIHLTESKLNDRDIVFIETTGFVFKDSDDYKKLKEWLEK